MFNLDDTTNENNEDHHKRCSYIPYHPYRMLMNGGSRSGKANAFLNSIKQQDSDNRIEKIYLYAKNVNEKKTSVSDWEREDVGMKHLNDPKAFIEYWHCMDDIYNNTDDYNPTRKRNILILFDDVIADISYSLIMASNISFVI